MRRNTHTAKVPLGSIVRPVFIRGGHLTHVCLFRTTPFILSPCFGQMTKCMPCLGQTHKNYITCLGQEAKTIPYPAVHPRISHIKGVPPGSLSTGARYDSLTGLKGGQRVDTRNARGLTFRRTS